MSHGGQRVRFRFFSNLPSLDVTTCRFQRSPQVLATPQGDEVVLIDVAGERYFTLNDVGRSVWAMLAEPVTLAEIVASIRREYDAPNDPEPDPVERDVAKLLRDLLSASLIVPAPAPAVSR
jgi:hypothetical protein